MDCQLVVIAPGMLCCPECGRLLRSKTEPARVFRKCYPVSPECQGVPTISTAGKLLLQIRPGDRIKALAEVTGIEAILKRLGCKCPKRRRRLNKAWDAWTMKWCAIPSAPKETSALGPRQW